MEEVTFSGKEIQDKHTHYEVPVYVGSSLATVRINGNVAAEFEKKYDISIRDAQEMSAQVEFTRNDGLVKVCQDPFKPDSHQTGRINSIDNITYNPEE